MTRWYEYTFLLHLYIEREQGSLKLCYWSQNGGQGIHSDSYNLLAPDFVSLICNTSCRTEQRCPTNQWVAFFTCINVYAVCMSVCARESENTLFTQAYLLTLVYMRFLLLFLQRKRVAGVRLLSKWKREQ